MSTSNRSVYQTAAERTIVVISVPIIIVLMLAVTIIGWVLISLTAVYDGLLSGFKDAGRGISDVSGYFVDAANKMLGHAKNRWQ